MMNRLVLAALVMPLGLSSVQEVVAPPERVTISAAAYKRMHQNVPVYACAAHVADALYAIGDSQGFVRVEVPVMAPLGKKIAQHPAIATGRLLHRLDVERIRMTQFEANESTDADGATFVDITTTLAFEMPPAEDDQLAAEIIGLALGSDPHITVTSQPGTVASGPDGLFEIPGLTMRVSLPQQTGPAAQSAPDEEQEDQDLEKASNSFASFARMNAQGPGVRLGPIVVVKPKPLPADGDQPSRIRHEVRTNGRADTNITVTKIANFTLLMEQGSRRISQVGLAVRADEDGQLEMKATFDIR